MQKSLVILGVLVGMLFSSLAYAELTKQDAEEIRKIVKEEVQDLRQEINIRIEDLKDLILSGFCVLFAGMFALVGFVLWDRRSALTPAVRKAKELEAEEEKIKIVLREYAMQEPRLALILRQVGIM